MQSYWIPDFAPYTEEDKDHMLCGCAIFDGDNGAGHVTVAAEKNRSMGNALVN